MIVTDVEGDLFGDLQPGDTIAHGVNCMGVMGAGVAKAFRSLYPENYRIYRGWCQRGILLSGGYLAVGENDHLILNLATQYSPGPDADIRWITSALGGVAYDYPQLTQIKTVRLGCGIGGLDWEDVKPAIEAIPSDIEIIAYFI